MASKHSFLNGQFLNLYGTSVNDMARHVIVGFDGNYLVAGTTGSSSSSKNAFISKINSNGEVIWTQSYGGNGEDEITDIIRTYDSAYIFIGFSVSTSSSGWDGWITKIDTSGSVIWSNRMGGNGLEFFRTIYETRDTNYIIGAGTASYGAGNVDAWFIKIDRDGNLIWTKTKGGSQTDYGMYPLETAGGDYLFTFYTNGVSSGYGIYDWNLIKFDKSGNTIFTKQYGSNGNEGVRDFKRTLDGQFLIIGETSKYTYGKGMLIKVDSAGNPLITKFYETSSNVHVDFYKGFPASDSGFVIAGQIGSDALLMKLDKSLDIVWARKFERNNTQFSWSVEIHNNQILWCGYSSQSGNSGGQDVFLIKADSAGNFDCRFVNANMSLFTPSTNVFRDGTASMSTGSGGSFSSFSVTPTSLNFVKKNFNLDTDSLPINLSGAASSLYVCQGDSLYLDGSSKATKWTWSTGHTTPGIYIDTTKQVSVRIERNYCYNSDTVNIILRDTLSLSLNRDTALCYGQVASFSVSAGGGNPAKYSYTWYDSSSQTYLHSGTTYQDTFFQDITLKVILWDSCSVLRDSGYLSIEVNPELSLNTPGDTTVCKGETVKFYSNGLNGILANYQYAWQNGLSTSDTLSSSFDTTTQIVVTLTDGCSQAPDTGKFYVIVRPAVTVELNSDTTICKGQIVSLRAQASGGDTSYNYIWNQNLGSAAVHSDTPEVTTTYQVIVNDGCTASPDTAEMTVTVRPGLSLSPRSDTTVCQGESFFLYATGSGGYAPNYRFNWSHGLDTGRNLEVSFDTSTQLQLILSDGCTEEDDTAVVSIQVRGYLSVDLPPDTTLCLGQSLQIQATGSGGYTSNYAFNWNLGLDTGSQKTVTPVSQTTYKVLLSDNCSEVNDSAEITVSVRPPIEVTVRSDSTICRGESIHLYASATGGDTSYSFIWDQAIGASQNPLVSPTHTTVYRVIVEDNCSLNNDTAFVTVTVRDSLSVTLATDTTICVGESTLLRAESFGGLSTGHQLTWNHGLSGNYTHLVQPSTTTSYQVILKDNCTLSQDTASVTVNVRDPLQIMPRSDTTICLGQSVLLYASGTGGTPSTHVLNWNQGLGNGVSHSVSPDTTTIYQVILSDNCTTNPDTGEVVVFVRPALTITPRNDTTICEGESVQLIAQSSGGYAMQYQLTWDQGVGQGNYLNVSPGTSTRYQVILQDNCTLKPDTGFVNILVRNPLTVLPRSDTTICVGQSVRLFSIGLGGDSSRYRFDWDQGLDTGRSQFIAPDTTTTYRVILSDACSERNDTSEITIFVRPPLALTERSDTFICVGEFVRLYAQGYGGHEPTYSFNWNNGLDTGQMNQVNPPVTTTYRVILEDQCTTDPDTASVIVYVRKPLTLVKRSDTTICIGEEVELYFDGTGGDSLHYTFIWNHDAGTGNYRKITPDTTTTYNVHLTDNCTLESGKDSVTITLREPLSIEAREDTTVCIGEGVHLYSIYSGGHTPGYQLEWDQNIGVTNVPLVFPDTTTEYLVVLRDFCTVAPDSDIVRIEVRPPLEINGRSDTMICVGEMVSLFAGSTGGYEPGYIFEWSHGLDTGQGNIVQPDTTTDYRVIVSDACTILADTGFVRISVREPLVIVPRMDTSICIGELVQLYAEAQGGDSSYYFRWDQGADTVDEPYVGPEITTSFEVIVRDNCTLKPDTGQVTVFVRPVLDVIARMDTLMCRGETVSLSASASGGDSLSYEFEWDAGIGITPSYLVTPDSTQTYRVIVRDFCTTKNDTDYVTIFTRDALSIQPRSDTTICIGQGVQVYGIPGGGNPNSYAYIWNNGLSGLERHYVSPQTTTTYSVILDDHCTEITDTAVFTINVRAPLELTVRTDTFICQGENVILYTNATGGDPAQYTYTWNQGIGPRSNPVVSPTVNTNYFVTLTDNCTTLSDTGSVNISLPIPLVISKSNDTLICRNDPVVMEFSGTGGLPWQYIYTWDKLGTGPVQTVRPQTTSWYAFELGDACALPVRDSILVNVQIPLKPGFRFDPEWACIPNDIQFDDTSGGPDNSWYRWEFGDGSSDTGINLLSVHHSFEDVGVYPLRLIVRTPLGCLDTSYTYNYKVHEDPIASFKHEYDDQSGTDMTIRFINTTQGGQDYYWDFGDLMTEEFVKDPIHAYAEPKLYPILLIAVNEWGCVDSTFDTLDVKDVFRVFIPSAFTPGGSDTLNDEFGPIGTGISHFDMQIYNRWGQLVYSTSTSETWDGKLEGIPLEIGVYTYIMRVFSTRDVKKSFRGTISIVR